MHSQATVWETVCRQSPLALLGVCDVMGQARCLRVCVSALHAWRFLKENQDVTEGNLPTLETGLRGNITILPTVTY